jgi:hypothetical protein
MAGNTLITIQDVSDRATAILQDKGNLLNLVRREDMKFTKKIGETYQMRVPERVASTSGRVAQNQDVTQSVVDLTINKQFHQAFSFTVQERSLSLDNFGELVSDPRASQIAADVESDLNSLYTGIYNSVGTAGTTPNTFALLQQASTRLNEEGAPKDNRWMYLNAGTYAGVAEVLHDIASPNQSLAASAMTEGYVGQTYDYKRGVYQSNAVRMHTNGAWGDSTPLTNGSTADGATQVVTNGWESGQSSVAVGDVFTLAGVYAVHPQTRQSTGELRQFVVNTVASDSGGAMTISMTPSIIISGRNQNCSATPANDAALTFKGVASGVYPQNLVGRPDAIALAMVDQDLTGFAEAAKSEFEGIRLAIISGPDVGNHEVLTRMDVIYGRALYRPEEIVRFWA